MPNGNHYSTIEALQAVTAWPHEIKDPVGQQLHQILHQPFLGGAGPCHSLDGNLQALLVVRAQVPANCISFERILGWHSWHSQHSCEKTP